MHAQGQVSESSFPIAEHPQMNRNAQNEHSHCNPSKRAASTRIDHACVRVRQITQDKREKPKKHEKREIGASSWSGRDASLPMTRCMQNALQANCQRQRRSQYESAAACHHQNIAQAYESKIAEPVTQKIYVEEHQKFHVLGNYSQAHVSSRPNQLIAT